MPPRPNRTLAALLFVTATALALAGCGRRGALEDPAAMKPKSTSGLIPSTEPAAKSATPAEKQVATPGANIAPPKHDFPLDSIL